MPVYEVQFRFKTGEPVRYWFKSFTVNADGSLEWSLCLDPKSAMAAKRLANPETNEANLKRYEEYVKTHTKSIVKLVPDEITMISQEYTQYLEVYISLKAIKDNKLSQFICDR